MLVASASRAATADSLATLPPPSVRRWQLGLTRADRLQHATLSFAGALAGARLSDRPLASFGAILLLGVAKECWDAKHGTFDPRDLTADVIGAGVGATLGR